MHSARAGLHAQDNEVLALSRVGRLRLSVEMGTQSSLDDDLLFADVDLDALIAELESTHARLLHDGHLPG